MLHACPGNPKLGVDWHRLVLYVAAAGLRCVQRSNSGMCAYRKVSTACFRSVKVAFDCQANPAPEKRRERRQ